MLSLFSAVMLTLSLQKMATTPTILINKTSLGGDNGLIDAFIQT